MGRKYIIELEDGTYEDGTVTLHRAKGFNSLVFDENGLKKLTPYDESETEKRGAKEAWKLAGRIVKEVRDGGMSVSEIDECFGTCVGGNVLKMDFGSAYSRYKEWMSNREKKKFEVGDEVVHGWLTFVVTQIDQVGKLYGIDKYGHTYADEDPYLWKRTGRHYACACEIIRMIRRFSDD